MWRDAFFVLALWSVLCGPYSRYKESSVMYHVPNMRGHLMLVHGMIDENVHFRHTGNRKYCHFLDATDVDSFSNINVIGGQLDSYAL